jgi:carbon-monoxide dehydrogenase catalytic subunit
MKKEFVLNLMTLSIMGGAPNLIKLLTQDLEGLTGGKLAVEADLVEAVNGMEAYILKKREALGI